LGCSVPKKELHAIAEPHPEHVGEFFTRDARQLPSTGHSRASFSSHIRRQFHKPRISDSDDQWRRCAATQIDVSNLFQKTASKSSLRRRLIANSPVIKPAVEEWLRLAVQQILKRR
jgi:hypothetical protein